MHGIAAGCAQTNLNIMRVAQGWSMCMNLEWLLCATRGLLPGMGDERIIYYDFEPRVDDCPLLLCAPHDLKIKGRFDAEEQERREKEERAAALRAGSGRSTASVAGR